MGTPGAQESTADLEPLQVPFVGWPELKVYMLKSCPAVAKLPRRELLPFRAEDDARRAGYTRSNAVGC